MMEESSETPRYDFYSDPVAAFSASKKSKASNLIAQAYVAPPTHGGSPETRFSPSAQGSINPGMTPPAHQVQQSYYSPDQKHQQPVSYSGFAPPAHQVQQSYYSPDQRHQRPVQYSGFASPVHQVQQSYYSPDQRLQRPVQYSGFAPHKNPAGMASPFPTHHGTPPRGSLNPEISPPAYQVQPSRYSPHQRHQRPVHHGGFMPHRSPAGMGSLFSMHQGTTPGGWNRPGSRPNYGFPCNAGAGTLAPNSGAYDPGVDHGQSRGHWLGTSPQFASGHGVTPSSGRGRGHWHGSRMSPGSGRSGGRGRGFHPLGLQPDCTLAPERFYHKSMVEDPWEHLKPVIWKSLDPPGSSNSWLPKSISMKKERVP